MVDSNLQREYILPSERAMAYKMKLEAIKRQGKRNDLTSEQVAPKLSTEEIGESENISKDTVKRYIRLTELEAELQQMVDEKKIGLTPAVEISYLKPDEQRLLIETIESEQSIPSLSQAKRMKQMSKEGVLNEDTILSVMSEQKKPEKIEVVLPYDSLAKYFPKSYTPHQMERMYINTTAFPRIEADSSMPLEYYAKVSGDVKNAEKVNAANVFFTISIKD